MLTIIVRSPAQNEDTLILDFLQKYRIDSSDLSQYIVTDTDSVLGLASPGDSVPAVTTLIFVQTHVVLKYVTSSHALIVRVLMILSIEITN